MAGARRVVARLPIPSALPFDGEGIHLAWDRGEHHLDIDLFADGSFECSTVIGRRMSLMGRIKNALLAFLKRWRSDSKVSPLAEPPIPYSDVAPEVTIIRFAPDQPGFISPNTRMPLRGAFKPTQGDREEALRLGKPIAVSVWNNSRTSVQQARALRPATRGPSEAYKLRVADINDVAVATNTPRLRVLAMPFCPHPDLVRTDIAVLKVATRPIVSPSRSTRDCSNNSRTSVPRLKSDTDERRDFARNTQRLLRSVLDRQRQSRGGRVTHASPTDRFRRTPQARRRVDLLPRPHPRGRRLPRARRRAREVLDAGGRQDGEGPRTGRGETCVVLVGVDLLEARSEAGRRDHARRRRGRARRPRCGRREAEEGRRTGRAQRRPQRVERADLDNEGGVRLEASGPARADGSPCATVQPPGPDRREGQRRSSIPRSSFASFVRRRAARVARTLRRGLLPVPPARRAPRAGLDRRRLRGRRGPGDEGVRQGLEDGEGAEDAQRGARRPMPATLVPLLKKVLAKLRTGDKKPQNSAERAGFEPAAGF